MLEDEAVGRVSSVPTFGRRGADDEYRSDTASLAGTAVTEDYGTESQTPAASPPAAKVRKVGTGTGSGARGGAKKPAAVTSATKKGKGQQVQRKSSRASARSGVRYEEGDSEEEGSEGEEDRGGYIEFDDEDASALEQLGLGTGDDDDDME